MRKLERRGELLAQIRLQAQMIGVRSNVLQTVYLAEIPDPNENLWRGDSSPMARGAGRFNIGGLLRSSSGINPLTTKVTVLACATPLIVW